MAASTLPGVLVAPFAGVIIDNSNKKRLFIAMDMLRGLCIILLAVAAYQGLIAIWMVFVAGILLSICGAIFNPGIQATVPDIVPKSKISNALSAFSILSTGSNMVGNAAGGFLYQALGAPVLFLFDGLSFLFSGTSVAFAKIPSNRDQEKLYFFKDMSDGFRYIWNQKGLRIILLLAAMSNFFFYIAIVLFLPFCKYTSSLGAGKYGIIMACFMGGGAAGFLALSIITVKPKNRFKVFVSTFIFFEVCMICAFNQPLFIAMAILIALAGFFNSVFNVLIISTVQIATSQKVRGKVMSFLNMVTQGLTPFAMAIGGVLGGIFPIRMVITASFISAFLVSIPVFFSKSFREYIKTDYDVES